ncbi:MAG: lipoate protein ligase C-terminal domain-containing protein, partial [Bacilli bacterium]|nr:lipoate protein ligase C-terminal domain-containing protein [Bacilli bacterium]
QSVSQRVCNLKDYINVPLSEIKKSLVKAFCASEIKEIPLPLIHPYQQALLNKEYIQGKKKQYNYHNQLNFKGGNIACDLLVKDGKIRDLAFSGDFFLLKDDDILIKDLINIPYERSQICDIVKACNISSCILEMDTATFTTLLVGGELKHE